MPAGLRGRLRRRAADTGRTQVAVLLDAIETTYQDLPRILEDRREAAAPRSGLFHRTPPRDITADGGSTVNMRVSADILATIDRLWQEAGAHSRSEYLRLALETYLGSEQDKTPSRGR